MAQLLRPWVEEVARVAGTPGTAVWHSSAPALDLMRALMCIGFNVAPGNWCHLVVDPRATPRHTILPEWWSWRVVLAYRLGGGRINALELRAIWSA
eukprot:1802621-Amphidinium_carterae.1